MTRTWIYLSNVIDNTTKRNFKNALTIVADHMSKMAADAPSDPEIKELYDRTKPLADSYASNYSSSILAKTVYSSQTQNFEEKINDLYEQKLKVWDADVQKVYLEGSVEYNAILGMGRSAFRQGTYEQRLAKVKALADGLKAYPELAELQAKVETFYQELWNARDLQQQKEGKVTEASKALEKARKDVVTMVFGNLGALIDKFQGRPFDGGKILRSESAAFVKRQRQRQSAARRTA